MRFSRYEVVAVKIDFLFLFICDDNLNIRSLIQHFHDSNFFLPKFRVYLGVRTCAVFLCFVAIVRVRVY